MVIGNICFQCNRVITKGFGYPKDDDEYKFCSKECFDKYLEIHKRRPIGIKTNCGW